MLWAAPAAAGEGTRSRDGVRGGASIQVKFDSGVGARIDTGDVVGGRSGAATAGDTELCTLHVELGARVGAGSVESDELTAEELRGRLVVVLIYIAIFLQCHLHNLQERYKRGL